MLKSLFKKQLLELKHLYFTSSQTGKQRSDAQIAGLLFLLALLVVGGASAFVGLGEGLATLLLPQSLDWLYFAAMGLFALIVATAVCMMSCYAQLFRAKDNDFLLSLPIPPHLILFVRITVVYLLSLVCVAIAWLPGIFEYISVAGRYGIVVDEVAVPFALLAWPFIAFLATALACIIGGVIAAIANRIRHKSVVATVAIIVLLVGYFIGYTMFMIDFQNSLEQGSMQISSDLLVAMQQGGWLLYQLGLAASGDSLGFVCFAGIAVLVFAVVYVVLAGSFRRLAIYSASGGQKKSFATQQLKARSIKQTLFKREVSRFVSSAAYMVNCGLGVVFLVIITIALAVNAETVSSIVTEIRLEEPALYQYIPVVLVIMAIALVCMSALTAPSISLEGKNLWIVRSLPIDPCLLMDAKIRLHLVVVSIPSSICLAIMSVVLGLDEISLVAAIWCVYSFVWVHAVFGLAMNLRMPKLSWTHETVPIKQSMPVFLAFMFGWVVAAVMFVAYFILADIVAPWIVLFAFAILFTVGAVLLNRWVHTSGVRRFEAL